MTRIPEITVEHARLFELWNQTAVGYRADSTVQALFREVASRSPGKVALCWDGGQLTYGELDTLSDTLAAGLLAGGVELDEPVALCMPRSPGAVVAALGVLKARGAYLPLDPDYPPDRIRFVLKDAGARWLLTTRGLADSLGQYKMRLQIVDDIPSPGLALRGSQKALLDRVGCGPGNLAYLMYTSGSTGTPKGVQIEHRSIVRLVGQVDYVQLDESTCFLHAAPLGFDASTLEIWGPLLHGGRVAVLREEIPTGRGIARLIAECGVNSAWLTAALFNTIVDEDATTLRGLRQLLTGGEALSPEHVRRAQAALPETELINGYGPTECTTFTTTCSIPRPLSPDARSIPIGRPIADTQVYVLDSKLNRVPIGVDGELFVGGLGLARGYLGRPDLDLERFVANPFHHNERLYRTGDIVRWTPDGLLEFIGRSDHQVKIRGFRIELGEIESHLASLPQVKACAVVAHGDTTATKKLVAYVVPNGETFAVSDIRSALESSLPDFMVPAVFVRLSSLPVTKNGKLDRKALPVPASSRPDLPQPYRAPAAGDESKICAIFAAVLGLDKVGALDGFFELGGDSLSALRVLTRIREQGISDISVATFFAAPNAAALVRAARGASIANGVRTLPAEPAQLTGRNEPIAIVGMAGRFPGADNIEQFWSNLCAGQESIRFFAPHELDPSIPAAVRSDPAYVAARGVLNDAELFDAAFFGISPLEARLMDPQHRHFLEVSWHALEHAGYAPENMQGPVGVFGGMYNATYFQRHLMPNPQEIARLGELQVMLANEKDYLTTRTAHKLGLSGPAVNVNTACSTSLVAISMAMDSLRNGSCDTALAGGAAITCPPNSGHLYQEGAMASPDGHTRTFDAQGGGTVFSDGVAVVVLRRLSDAVAAGDTIHAVLLGSAVNNDGRDRASFTAPSPEGQAAVIAAAHDNAGINARSISYVEAHGTATPLGDPIEIDGLTRAFRRHTEDRGFCAIGSVKSNLGHLVIAAGVAGVIKTALALEHKLLPPSIGFSKPSPMIDFDSTPFRVQTSVSAWPGNSGPRRAGVSAFGFGGTNCHVVMQEAPEPSRSPDSLRDTQLLVLSARTDAALEQAAANLADYFHSNGGSSLADAAYTLQVGRREFPKRRFVVARDAADARRHLTQPDVGRSGTRELSEQLPEICFMFPGQGSQYERMGQGLYATEPAFRAAYDECCAFVAEITGGDPKEKFFSNDPSALVATSVTQPAIFALEYSLARLWVSWGLVPAALIGHSVGELVAAALADVMPLRDAVGLVVERGRRMQALPAGSMLSVRMPADALEQRLPAGVVIAAVNAPGLCVASGETELIAQLESALSAEGIAARRLVTSHAFHSPMMDPVIEPLASRLQAIKLSAPTIPIVSTVSGDWLTAEQATSVRYWAEHLRKPVRFAAAVARLMEEPRRVLVELGPRATLSALAKQSVPAKRSMPLAIPSLADAVERESDSMLIALGQLWITGAKVDWAAFHHDVVRHRVPLPAYPFQRLRHWIDAPPQVILPVPVANTQEIFMTAVTPNPPKTDRNARLLAAVREMVEEVSGIDVSDSDPKVSWLDLGLDSLALTQLALQVQRAHGVKVTFRQIMENFPTVASLAEMLDQQLAPDLIDAQVVTSANPSMAPPPVTSDPQTAGSMPPGYLQQVIDQQLKIMAQQLAALSGGGAPAAVPAARKITKDIAEPGETGPVSYDVKKAFGAIARIHTVTDELTALQRARLDALVARYNARTARSKAYTAQHRGHMADPRVVNGFRPLTKELTYQVVIERSRGSRMWDIDGNEYVDVLSGFGMSLFGWQPDFLREAIHRQIDLGYEIGPQHVLAGEVAELFCKLTGADRAAFCNTGSEAVMGAMRIARTVTGRSLIAIFTGAYHGIFDEVIVRGTRKLKSIPAAPGIMPSASQNVLVLDYGTAESLAILRERANELAAIVVEPVQSRRPDFQPAEFLRDLRKLTSESGSLLVFDEVVTGFRAHPRGIQGLFGIDADLATYGKVVGGGFSIGVIAGKRSFMDALDGGQWEYGDASIPTVGVTYFAGTFVRHPLALAASKAALQHMLDAGPELQEKLTARTAAMVAKINTYMEEIGAPFKLNTFASLWRNVFTEDLPYGDLIYTMLRDRGIHILDNFPCFLTTAHSDEDIAKIVEAYEGAADEMQASGFFPARHARPAEDSGDALVVSSTEPQREVWLADHLGVEESLAYNESISLHFRGEMDIAALRAAVRDLPRRFDSLRSTFTVDGVSMRVPAAAPELDVPLLDFSELTEHERADRFAALKRQHVSEPFDLAQGPLIRAEIAKLGPDHHVLIFTGHHIVIDGWSFWVLVKDLAAIYQQRIGSRSVALPEAPAYVAYARDRALAARLPELQANEKWWTTQFVDGVPVLDLPTDRLRPKQRTTRSAREDYILDAGLLAQIKKLGAGAGASLFATLFAGFSALLHRLSGQSDIVIGIPAAGQNAAPEYAGLVGHCVNMLPLRSRPDAAQSFSDLAKATRTLMLDGYDHQDVTFGRLLQLLPVQRDPGRLPLISVIFNIDQALSAESHAITGVDLELATNPRCHETFDLFVNAVDCGAAGMRLECQYNADLFDAESIRRWVGGYEELMRGAVSNPACSLAQLPVVTREDRKLLAAWNTTEARYPRDQRVELLVREAAQRNPVKIAVHAGERSLSYGELIQRAADISGALAENGVRRGDRVGLLVDRDEHLLPTLLGILGCGATYVPLDTSFPEQRLKFMLDDAGIGVVATSHPVGSRCAGLLLGRRVVLVDRVTAGEAPAHGGTADDAAYVIYTSGSTGIPKGVAVPHRAVGNFVASMQRVPGLTSGSTFAAVTTISFDIAVLELLVPLTLGMEIVLVSRDEARDGAALQSMIQRCGVTAMQATPATWRLLVDSGWRGGTNFKALCGGEALNFDLARTLLDRVGELWNMYGPTETTVWSSCHRVSPGDDRVYIGRPIANTQIHVLDSSLCPVPVGVVGEIYIGGDGVSLGYLGRTDLTAERFLSDPFCSVSGARLYRTGDLGRWHYAGGASQLECLGRTDHQVKVRGYRIELGEIESLLARHAAVAQAVVVAREDRPGDVRLVAYVVAGAEPPREGELRDFLAPLLPEYMIPQRFVILPVMPLTGSGKVDRRALPVPEASVLTEPLRTVAPRGATEELVVKGFQSTLALPRVSVTDNFFSLGGHSLLAAQMAARLSVVLNRQVPMRAVFEHATPERLAAWLDSFQGANKGGALRVPRRPGKEPAPLSLMQQRVWYLEQLNLGRTVFNVPSAHRLRGELDVAALQKSFSEIVRHQPVLRTGLKTIDGEPVQLVTETLNCDIPVDDLSVLPADKIENELAARMAREARIPFKLEQAPLFRVRLFRLASDHHVLFFMPHHAIWDGWSFDLFYEEMAACYSAYSSRKAPALPALAVDYADFSVWHRQWMAGPELERQLEHWRRKLDDAPTALDLPLDHPRPAQQSGEGDTAWLTLPESTVAPLRTLGVQSGATLFMTLLTTWALLLSRMSGQRELVIGTPVRGRNSPELEPVMGFFVNALPLRLQIDPARSFSELLQQVRSACVEAFEFQDVPFEHLVRVLDLPRDESRFPIYQTFFSYQDARQRPSSWGGLAHQNVPIFQPSAAQDLSLWFLDGNDGVVGGINYNTDIFTPATAARVKARYLALAAAIAGNPQRPVRDLLAVDATEMAQMRSWNLTQLPLPEAQDVISYLNLRGDGRQDRIAIRFAGETVSYAQLADQSRSIAALLRSKGVGAGDVVGLYLTRTPRMIAALLGVLESGATYLPIDPEFPESRVNFMLADANVRMLICDQDEIALKIAVDRILQIDAAVAFVASGDAASALPTTGSDRAAYLIYTSGSTGKPKGVLVPHGAVINFLNSMQREPDLTPQARLAAVTTISFDIAILELLLPLAVGAEIVLVSRDDARDGHALRAILESQAVNVMQATPATWRLLVESGWRGAADFKALCGGEALPIDIAEALLARTGELWNMYGPTETTVWSACTRIEPGQGDIRIGKPIANTQIWILDDRGEPAPIGVPGEIHIGGAGVALGYHNRPELTAERFVADQFGTGANARLYRTGDLGRWCHDGLLQHLGRTDFQVKVRGYRIELGEIETALTRHAQVAQSVVIAHQMATGDTRLMAYVVPKPATVLDEPGLLEHLRAELPDYMVPWKIVPIAALPMTPNGKINRKALPAPSLDQPGAVSPLGNDPRTPSEVLVADIWRQLLGARTVARQDNFLDLGGHSLLIMRAVAQLENRAGIRLSPRAFVFQTLEQIAAEVDSIAATSGQDQPDPSRRGSAPRSKGLLQKVADVFRSVRS